MVGSLGLLTLFAAPPAWWSLRHVLTSDQVQDNRAAVTVGQIRNFATKAMEEMDERWPGVGAGADIHNMIGLWDEGTQSFQPATSWRARKALDDQYAAANVGQLKFVAKKFYDRLVAVGLRDSSLGYPWNPNTPAEENFALVNAGQVKNVFSFDIPSSSVIITQTDGQTAVTEGGAEDSYTIRLSRAPVGSVTIGIASQDGQLTPSPSTVTFTSSNWSTPVSVTVGAVDDAISEGTHSGVIIHSIAEGGDPSFDILPLPSVTVSITDNDSQGLVVTTPQSLALTVAEGSSGSISVRLAAQPAASVTVNAARSTGDESLTVASGAQLTFTTANWNTPQQVTIAAAEDADGLDGTASIKLSSTGLSDVTVTVTEDDNDTPAVVIAESGGSTAVAEAGMQDTYTVRLATLPLQTVTVTVQPAADQLTAAPTSLEFTPANWDQPQTVTVTAVDDALSEASPHTAQVAHTVTSTDTSYGGLAAPSVTVSITDNDPQSLVVTTPQSLALTVAEGDGGSISVRLAAQPAASVTVNAARSTGDASLTVAAGAQLTFTTANWNIPQQVTIAAAEDADGVDGTASIRLSSAGLSDVIVTVTEDDNDTPAVIIAESGGSTTVTEAGAQDAYTVALSTLPLQAVTVTVQPAAGQLTVSPTSLEFTPANWDQPQTVTVTAVDDVLNEASPHTAQITHTVTSTDTLYSGLAAPAVAVSITDNDPIDIVWQRVSGLSIEEGGQGTLTVKLKAQPAPNTSYQVVASLVSGSDASLTLGTIHSWTFDEGNWDQLQELVISAAEDTDQSNGTGTVRLTISSLSLSEEVNFDVIDNDTIVSLTDSDGDRYPDAWETADQRYKPAEHITPHATASPSGSSLQQAYDSLPNAEGFYVIRVEPGVYADGVVCGVPARKVLWLADLGAENAVIRVGTRSGAALQKPAFSLNQASVLDGFVIEGTDVQAAPAIVVSTPAQTDQVKILNTLVRGWHNKDAGEGIIEVTQGEVAFVHCTLWNNRVKGKDEAGNVVPWAAVKVAADTGRVVARNSIFWNYAGDDANGLEFTADMPAVENSGSNLIRGVASATQPQLRKDGIVTADALNCIAHGNGTHLVVADGVEVAPVSESPIDIKGQPRFSYPAGDNTSTRPALGAVEWVNTETGADADDLPDWWEKFYYSALTTTNASNTEQVGTTLGDSLNNLAEFWACTSPLLADSESPLDGISDTLQESLEGHWPLNNSAVAWSASLSQSLAFDSSSHGVHAVGNFARADAAHAYAADFTAPGSYLSLPAAAMAGRDRLTLSFWLQRLSSATDAQKVVLSTSAGGQQTFAVEVSSTGLVIRTQRMVDDTVTNFDWTVTVPAGYLTYNAGTPGGWHHVVITRDRSLSMMTAYVDGYQVGQLVPKEGSSQLAPGQRLAPIAVDEGGLVLGQDATASAFRGWLHSARIYSRILSETEVLALNGNADTVVSGLAAGDELPDSWENIIVDKSSTDSITSVAQVLAGGDFDQDGISNITEWRNNTDPTTANSIPTPVLTIGNVDWNSVTLSWTIPSGDVTGFTLERQTAGGAWERWTAGGAWELIDGTNPPIGPGALSPQSRGFVDSPLLPETDYVYRLIAVRTGYVPGATPKDEKSTHTLARPLPAPFNLKGSFNDSGDLALSWDADDSVATTGFRVALASGGAALGSTTPASVKTLLLTGLPRDQTISLVVRAYRGTNPSTELVSSPSNVLVVDTPPTAPAAPTGLAANLHADGISSIALTWSAVSGATSYEILRRKLGETDYATLASGLTTLSFTDQALEEVTSYQYVAAAVVQSTRSGSTARSRTLSSLVTASTTTLRAPIALTARSTAEGVITLGWVDQSAKETGYEVQRSPATGEDAFATVSAGGIPADAVSWQNGGLDKTQRYKYRLRAIRSLAGDSVASAWITSAIALAGGNVAPDAFAFDKDNPAWSVFTSSTRALQMYPNVCVTDDFIYVSVDEQGTTPPVYDKIVVFDAKTGESIKGADGQVLTISPQNMSGSTDTTTPINFGYAMAGDKGWLFVGAPGRRQPADATNMGETGDTTGAVYVYQHQEGGYHSWVIKAKIRASSRYPYHDTFGLTNWVMPYKQPTHASGSAPTSTEALWLLSDSFGASLTFNKNTLVIGAPDHDWYKPGGVWFPQEMVAFNWGRAYYVDIPQTGNSWPSNLCQISADNEANGTSYSISRKQVVETGGGTQFPQTMIPWVDGKVADDQRTPPDFMPSSAEAYMNNAYQGAAVDILDDVILIGAPGHFAVAYHDDSSGLNSDKFYSWQRHPYDGAIGGISQNRLAGSGAGHAFVCTRFNGGWVRVKSMSGMAAGQQFGRSVSIRSDRMICVGSPGMAYGEGFDLNKINVKIWGNVPESGQADPAAVSSLTSYANFPLTPNLSVSGYPVTSGLSFSGSQVAGNFPTTATGIQLTGYIKVKTSGNYRFLLESADKAEFRVNLNSSDQPQGKDPVFAVLTAAANTTAASSPYTYQGQSGQLSTLSAGKWYYFELIAKDSASAAVVAARVRFQKSGDSGWTSFDGSDGGSYVAVSSGGTAKGGIYFQQVAPDFTHSLIQGFGSPISQTNENFGLRSKVIAGDFVVVGSPVSSNYLVFDAAYVGLQEYRSSRGISPYTASSFVKLGKFRARDLNGDKLNFSLVEASNVFGFSNPDDVNEADIGHGDVNDFNRVAFGLKSHPSVGDPFDQDLYKLKVRVKDDNGELVSQDGTWIRVSRGDIYATPTAPDPVTGVRSGTNGQTITLTWKNVGAEKYDVIHLTADGTPLSTLPNSANLTTFTFSYTLSGDDRTDHYFRVVSRNGTGGSALTASSQMVTVVWDSDGDQLPDWWEQRLVDSSTTDYIVSISQIRGDGDFDHDGLSNAQEYALGTKAYAEDPTGANNPAFAPLIWREGGDGTKMADMVNMMAAYYEGSGTESSLRSLAVSSGTASISWNHARATSLNKITHDQSGTLMFSFDSSLGAEAESVVGLRKLNEVSQPAAAVADNFADYTLAVVRVKAAGQAADTIKIYFQGAEVTSVGPISSTSNDLFIIERTVTGTGSSATEIFKVRKNTFATSLWTSSSASVGTWASGVAMHVHALAQRSDVRIRNVKVSGFSTATIPTDSTDLDHDGLTRAQELARAAQGQSYGINPDTWDLDPDGDLDGDGIPNKEDAFPNDASTNTRMTIIFTAPASL